MNTRTSLFSIVFSVITLWSVAQTATQTITPNTNTGIGIALFPTGTDVGLGIRTNKNKKWVLDARIAKANFYTQGNQSSFTNEASAVCRVVKLEKVRFHAGIGVRTEWHWGPDNRYGLVAPLGVEAFPFPFQNAGLFFEVAPFFTESSGFFLHNMTGKGSNYVAGLRTVAGFVFYFPRKDRASETKTN